MVKTLLDMSELQTVGRDDEIVLDALVDEVLEDLEPLAEGKNIRLIGNVRILRWSEVISLFTDWYTILLRMP